MRDATSIYLDVLRFGAACVVFAGHAGMQAIGGGIGWQLTPFGASAVLIFFVLSGFVIAHVTTERETTGQGYAVARLARLFSVVVPALVLTAVLDALGASLRPDLYHLDRQLLGQGAWAFPVSLAFLNQFHRWDVTPGTDVPYWSLSYEAAYYLMFGIAWYIRGAIRWLGLAAMGAAAGWHILALFPVWLIGFGAYHLGLRAAGRRALGWSLVVTSLGAASVLLVLASRQGLELLTRPVLAHGPTGIGQDYLLALIVAANLIGMNAIARDATRTPPWIARPVRWLAGATFTLYLTHVPLIMFVRAMLGSFDGTLPAGVVMLALAFAGVLLVAQFTERKKRVWVGLFTRLFGRADPAMGRGGANPPSRPMRG